MYALYITQYMDVYFVIYMYVSNIAWARTEQTGAFNNLSDHTYYKPQIL